MTKTFPTEAPPELFRPAAPSALFALTWATVADLLGTAATATLVRRSLKAASSRVPELARVQISKERLEYRFTLPPAWDEPRPENVEALRELMTELQLLLRELTGPVVVQRLRAVPELERSKLFPPENAP